MFNVKLLQNNWIYFLWFAVYVLITWLCLGATLVSLGITVVLYAISIGIALSPAGEHILRYMLGFREIATKKEREYLLGIFNEVRTEAWKKSYRISMNIQIYVSDKMNLNAFALGKNTICVTKGAIEGFSESELKGVLAHELGHIANGDTIALLLNFIGNGIFSIFVMIQKLATNFFDFFRTSFGDGLAYSMLLAIKLASVMLSGIVWVFTLIGEIILSINSRKNEYNADKFAYDIGYGDELLQSLYTLHEISSTSNMKLTTRLKKSHPHLAYRIRKLETA